ncbi:hypothetical protein AXK58_21335 [Tsukamurella tyrosinosolvens]|nr:hypothetical protein AXK58_21335 [Tsukamurella tyrosinosolvens]
MYEPPKTPFKEWAPRALVVVALVWAVVAVPLCGWLLWRGPEPTPQPAERELTAVDAAAVSYAHTAVTTGWVQVKSQVTSSIVRLEVEQTVEAATGNSTGRVLSASTAADLLVLGDKVMLRGNAEFWATLGVMTSTPGWVDVENKLGDLPFPLAKAAKSLAPSKDARIGTSETDKTEFRNGDLRATFSRNGISSLTLGDRAATVADTAPPAAEQLAAWQADAAITAKLSGVSGSLTVAPAPAPPRPSSSAAPSTSSRPAP